MRRLTAAPLLVVTRRVASRSLCWRCRSTRAATDTATSLSRDPGRLRPALQIKPPMPKLVEFVGTAHHKRRGFVYGMRAAQLPGWLEQDRADLGARTDARPAALARPSFVEIDETGQPIRGAGGGSVSRRSPSILAVLACLAPLPGAQHDNRSDDNRVAATTAGVSGGP